jgi:hypothetical protein
VSRLPYTAFVGRALRGPTDLAVTVNSFGDFERTFGGPWLDSALGFRGARSSFLTAALRPSSSAASIPARAVLPRCRSTGSTSRRPGREAGLNQLRVRIDHDTRPLLPGEPANSLFNLSVKDVGTGGSRFSQRLGHRPATRAESIPFWKMIRSLLRATAVPNARPNPHAAINPGENTDPFGDAFPARYTVVAAGDQANDGNPLTALDISDASLEAPKRGMFALLDADLFNLLCVPPHKLSSAPDPSNADVEPALSTRRWLSAMRIRAFMIVDPPYGSDLGDAPTFQPSIDTSNHAALYFPTLLEPIRFTIINSRNSLPAAPLPGSCRAPIRIAASGKRPPDSKRGSPVVTALSVPLTDAECGSSIRWHQLSSRHARRRPGRLGRAHIGGERPAASEWKYSRCGDRALPRGDHSSAAPSGWCSSLTTSHLWAQIRLNVGAFMQSLFRQGAFQGKTPKEAYLVKCDSETTTQDDINRGVVNILVGFAPLKPAEFVIIQIQQWPDKSNLNQANDQPEEQSWPNSALIHRGSIPTRTLSSG